MILKEISIENIRSIKSIKLKFNLSISLFYGDIGAGKSSVLKSIEFALFGSLTSSDLGGESLLRRGENKGSVELTFSIDNDQFTIKRFLSRSPKSGKITQLKDSYIIENGVKKTTSVLELRKKVLSLLHYSVIRYEKAKKIPLFRYTVYTPQEQVKEILEAKPEERFEILKDVFGIEKYEIALKNIDVFKDNLTKNIREFEGRIRQIGDQETLISEKERKIGTVQENLSGQEIKIKEKDNEIENEEQEVDKIQLEWNEYRAKLNEVNRKENKIKDTKKSKDKNRKELEELIKEISEKEKQLKELSSSSKLTSDHTEKEIKQKISEIRNLATKNKEERAITQNKIDDIDKLLKKGKCSLCGQKIHEKERFEKEKEKSIEAIENLTNTINNTASEIEKLEADAQNLNEYNKNNIKRESLKTILDEKKKRKLSIDKLINELEKNKNEISSVLKDYGIENLEEFKNIERNLANQYEGKKSKLRNLKNEKETLIRSNSSDKKELEFLKEEVKRLKNSIKTRKILQKKLNFMTDLKEWITNNFKTLLRNIERKILASSAVEFNAYFKEWFKTLVEGENIEVEIRLEDFQPIINVNGHETPFSDLSGGEKSSLSLAYRLALNKIINDRYQEIKTKNLLILDEPTDGFSQEQINRMQFIFEKLNMGQMIIISHDRNLDSFVTDIYNFRKEFHETIISKGKTVLAEEPSLVLKSFECPECTANLDISKKEGNLVVCEFCKKPFLVQW